MSQWVSNNRGISQHCSSPAPSLLAVMDSSLSLLPWKWFQFCVSAPRLPASPRVSKRQTSPRPLWKKSTVWKAQRQSSLNIAFLVPWQKGTATGLYWEPAMYWGKAVCYSQDKRIKKIKHFQNHHTIKAPLVKIKCWFAYPCHPGYVITSPKLFLFHIP